MDLESKAVIVGRDRRSDFFGEPRLYAAISLTTEMIMRIRDSRFFAPKLLERAMRKAEYTAAIVARRSGCTKCHAPLD